MKVLNDEEFVKLVVSHVEKIKKFNQKTHNFDHPITEDIFAMLCRKHNINTAENMEILAQEIRDLKNVNEITNYNFSEPSVIKLQNDFKYPEFDQKLGLLKDKLEQHRVK